MSDCIFFVFWLIVNFFSFEFLVIVNVIFLLIFLLVLVVDIFEMREFFCVFFEMGIIEVGIEKIGVK